MLDFIDPSLIASKRQFTNVRLIECLEKAVGEEEQDVAAAEPAFAVTSRFAGVGRSDFRTILPQRPNAET